MAEVGHCGNEMRTSTCEVLGKNAVSGWSGRSDRSGGLGRSVGSANRKRAAGRVGAVPVGCHVSHDDDHHELMIIIVMMMFMMIIMLTVVMIMMVMMIMMIIIVMMIRENGVGERTTDVRRLVLERNHIHA